MRIESLLLNSDASLKDAIYLLEKTDKGIVLVIDKKGILIGTITDGDIRRALLNCFDLKVEVKEVMRRNMIVLNEKTEFIQKKAELLMVENNIRQIPVLNNKGMVVDLITYTESGQSIIKKLPIVVVMAGGLGSRLLPLTEKTPKPMLRLGEQPMLEIVLNNCVRAGLKEFYFAVNHLKEQIIEYFGDGSKWGVDIKYLEEKKPLGTAGALKLLPFENDKPILVLNGDILTNLNVSNLIGFHNKFSSFATVCVREHLEKLAYGVVHLNNELVESIEEKPSFSHYVNAGIYLIDPVVLDFIVKDKPMDMPELLTLLIRNKMQVSACPIHEYWLDVGQPETLSKAKQDWVNNKVKIHK